MAIAVAKFLDVANGLQANQFSVGDHVNINSLDDIDPIYKPLLDGPVPAMFAVLGSDGRPNLTPMWFDYEGATVLVNVATHRKKVDWIRANPKLTLLLVNPANMYHWVSIKCTVKREILEDDPKDGARVTKQLDKIWTKYTQQPAPYGLRDPSKNERRVLFECPVDKIATFGKP
jgi:PPOX class probable F420-dependent enzyme